MNFIIVLVCATVAVLLLRKPLMKYPMVFYTLAVLLNIMYVAHAFVPYPELVRRGLFLLMQKCTLSLALFTVVMFVGVFRKDSRAGLSLRPVRAELSILACLLAVGHMAMYLLSFAPRLADIGALDGRFALFFATAMALLALLLVLGVTSAKGVKRRMDASAWKKLQKWAYVFFGLIYVHLVSILLPSALLQGVTAQISIVVYTVLFGSYATLRIYRAVSDRVEDRAKLAESVA